MAYYTILNHNMLYYTILHYTILYYTTLYCTILYYTILYSILINTNEVAQHILEATTLIEALLFL